MMYMDDFYALFLVNKELIIVVKYGELPQQVLY